MRLEGLQLQKPEQSAHYHELALAELSHIRSDPHDHDQIEMNLLWHACEIDAQRREYVRAEENCRRALALHERLFGTERPPYWIASLAEVYKRQGRYAEALPLYRQALEVREQANGPEHPRTARAIYYLAEALAEQGQYAESFVLFRRALSIYQKSFGEHSPRLFDTLSQLARWSAKAGGREEALEYARQAFEVVRDSKEVSKVTEGRRLLGEALFRQKQFAAALAEHQAALDLCEQGRCEGSLPGLLIALADDLRELGRARQARPLLEEALRLLPATDRELLARADFALARTLIEGGGQPTEAPRARTLAEKARQLYKEQGPSFDGQRAEVDSWLTTLNANPEPR
jgi:tetratricopeptide (TPR) repeat protein